MMAQYRHLMPYTRRGDERLGVDVAGPPQARSIMFLHCAGANRRIWLPQMHRLANAFQVIALDRPRHGALADMPFSLGAAREHVVAVMEAWAGERALS